MLEISSSSKSSEHGWKGPGGWTLIWDFTQKYNRHSKVSLWEYHLCAAKLSLHRVLQWETNTARWISALWCNDEEAGIILLLLCVLLVSEAIGSLHLPLPGWRCIVVLDLPDRAKNPLPSYGRQLSNTKYEHFDKLWALLLPKPYPTFNLAVFIIISGGKVAIKMSDIYFEVRSCWKSSPGKWALCIFYNQPLSEVFS